MSSPTTVQILDAFGNLATADTSKVTLKIKTGPTAAQPLHNATTNAIAGVATFAALTLPTAGTYTLTAADGTLTSPISNSFIVT